MQQIVVFNADNTYTFSSSMSGAKKGLEVNGTYSISGKELKLSEGKSNIPGMQGQASAGSPGNLPPVTTIVSQTATTLVLHYGTEMTRGGKTFVISIDDTFTKE
jgi:hypothetical protein